MGQLIPKTQNFNHLLLAICFSKTILNFEYLLLGVEISLSVSISYL